VSKPFVGQPPSNERTGVDEHEVVGKQSGCIRSAPQSLYRVTQVRASIAPKV
jgi:hypothetical protein